ncbi:MAG: hypothetical protein KKC55_17135 [Gammaproteobacteria bacterium]|nr:hypothetical protein [Gammaproteobacteria bacterium]
MDEEKEVVEKKAPEEKKEVKATEVEIKEKEEIPETIEEKGDADPFDSWEDVFPELASKEEEPIESKEEMTEDSIRKIVREEIKNWVKGVNEGKYPFPKGKPKDEKEPSQYPYPSKDEIDEMSASLQKSFDGKFTELTTQLGTIEAIQKSINELKTDNEAIKKEVEIIRDQPAQIIEKSNDRKRKGFKSNFNVREDGTIEYR